jgi:hypothetical protein
MPYPVCDVLVYQKNGNVLPLFSKTVECFLDHRGFGLLVDDEEITLRIWRLSNMAYTGEEQTSD